MDQLNAEQSKLVCEHIEFTKKIASQFYAKRTFLGFERDDFEGAAMLGLCDAARRFDKNKGMLFRTFVYFRIRGAMYDLLRAGSGIQRRQYNRLIQNTITIDDEDERAKREPVDKGPSTHAVASGNLPYPFARSVNELAGLLNVIDQIGLQLHISCEGEAELSYAQDQNPETLTVLKHSKRYLKSLVAQLPESQRVVIERHYYREETLKEIAIATGKKSKSWLSRTHRTALESLRGMIEHDLRETTKRIDAAA